MSASDEATKQRIITHMNTDHQDSLVRYLEHHHALPSSRARFAKLTSISLSSLTITASGLTYTIPISPPMTSLAQARDRVVAMDAESIAYLRRSPITLKTYIPPVGSQLVIMFFTLLGFFSFSYPAQFEPGHVLYSVVWTHVPGFAATVARHARLGLLLMLGIHGGECVLMHYKKLRRHSVPMGSAVWVKWMVSTFLEGFGCFARINAYVKAAQAEKDKKKH